MSTILKRFEIWVLFGLVAAAVWWAFQTENEVVEKVDPDKGVVDPGNNIDSAGLAGHLKVKNVKVIPDEEGILVELTLQGRSGTDKAEILNHSNLEILTTEGDQIQRFYLPFESDQVLSPDETSLVTLKYWLKEKAEVLWLTYRDQTVKVELPSA